MIELVANGVPYSNFTSGFVSIRIDALSNTFSFSTTSEEGKPLPFKGGEPVEVLVEGIKVLTGHIEVVSVDYSDSSHTITVSGRDKTGDLLDSTIDNFSNEEINIVTDSFGRPVNPQIPGASILRKFSDVRAPIDLDQVIQLVLNKINLDILVVKSVFAIAPFNKAEDIFSIKPGQNAFSFIEKLAKKRNVLLTSDNDGNIVIGKPTGRFVEATVQNIIGSDTNNIKSGSVSYDTTGRFNFYSSFSSQNPVALNFAGLPDLARLVNQSGGAFDDEIRISRQLVFAADAAYSSEQNKERADWEANIRRTRGRIYSAEVIDYKNQAGELWDINTIINVRDDFAGINDQMLVNQVDYKIGNSGGSITTLGLVDKDAYTLAIEKPKAQPTSQGLGLGLT